MENKTAGNTQAAISAGKQLMGPKVIDVAGVPTLVTHRDSSVSKHEELLPKPLALKQNVRVHDAESFLKYFQNFADKDSHIFVDIENAKFKAVIDYHQSAGSPRWNRHTVSFTCPTTPEWNAWKRNSGQRMNQSEFALFIEDNLLEIVEPSGAEMLEIASSLQAKNDVSFSSATRLDNGETQFSYKEDVNGSAGINGQLQIPQSIKLGLTPFRGSETYQVEARFRYRIKDGNLMMWYDLVRPHRIHEDAIKDTCEKIKNDQGIGHILMGDCPA